MTLDPRPQPQGAGTKRAEVCSGGSKALTCHSLISRREVVYQTSRARPGRGGRGEGVSEEDVRGAQAGRGNAGARTARLVSLGPPRERSAAAAAAAAVNQLTPASTAVTFAQLSQKNEEAEEEDQEEEGGNAHHFRILSASAGKWAPALLPWRPNGGERGQLWARSVRPPSLLWEFSAGARARSFSFSLLPSNSRVGRTEMKKG